MKKSRDLGKPFATIRLNGSTEMSERLAIATHSKDFVFDLSFQTLSPDWLVAEIGRIGVGHVLFDNMCLSSVLLKEAEKYALPLLAKGISVVYYFHENNLPMADDWIYGSLINIKSFSGANTLIELDVEWLRLTPRCNVELADELSTEIDKGQEALNEIERRVGEQIRIKITLLKSSPLPQRAPFEPADLEFIRDNS